MFVYPPHLLPVNNVGRGWVRKHGTVGIWQEGEFFLGKNLILQREFMPWGVSKFVLDFFLGGRHHLASSSMGARWPCSRHRWSLSVSRGYRVWRRCPLSENSWEWWGMKHTVRRVAQDSVYLLHPHIWRVIGQSPVMPQEVSCTLGVSSAACYGNAWYSLLPPTHPHTCAFLKSNGHCREGRRHRYRYAHTQLANIWRHGLPGVSHWLWSYTEGSG